MTHRRIITFLVLITVFLTSLSSPAKVERAQAAILLNSAPAAPILGAPSNNATGVSANPTLRVRVTDPDGDPLTVTFYGRIKGASASQKFTIVAVPDTQNYTDLSVVKDGDQKFYSEMQWIVDNRSTNNIVYVAGLGDITQHGNASESEWVIADTAYKKLEMGTSSGADDIPFGPAVGNHDPLPDMTSFALYEKYFGVQRFNGRPYYGGHYGTDNVNSYYLFSVYGMNFMTINVDCSDGTPSTAIRDWAEALLQNNLNRRGIIVCHNLIEDPVTGAFSSTGQKMYDAFKDNSNLFMMLAGHVKGQAHRTDPGTDGHNIYTLLSDFQSSSDGGNGWIQLMEFQPANNLVQVKTYSPWLNQWDTDSNSQFTLPYTMVSEFAQIGSPVSAASGTDASVTWPGLALGTQYEWYAVASDGQASTPSSTWTFTTISTNRAPVANSQSVSTAEDTPLPITLTASDADGDPLTYTVLGNPTSGSLSGTAPNLTYTPAANSNASDSFTFKVNDGHVDSSAATINISVTPVNDAPVCHPVTMPAEEDLSATISPSCMDADGDLLTFSIVDPAQNGTASIAAPKLKYKGNLNYNGTDSFTYKATDTSSLNSAPAAVTVIVSPVNDAPTCSAVSLTTNEDIPGTAAPACLDVDGDPLTYNIIAGAGNGSASVAGGQLAYTPLANYYGPDSFTYNGTDGVLSSGTASVSVNVIAINDAPVAQNQSPSTSQGVPLSITLQASDVENAPLTYILTSSPQYGVLSGTAPDLTYTPAPDYSGPDSFKFKVSDGKLDSSEALVSITVISPNVPPVADSQNLSTAEDTALPIKLTATDKEGDPLSYSVVSGPAHGVLSGTAPNLTYTPATNYTGPDSFTFKANDGLADSAEATISITVTLPNHAPVCAPVSLVINEDTIGQAAPSCTDEDGNPLTYLVKGQPAHGKAFEANGKFAYTPDKDYNGPDSFTYSARDGTAESKLVTISITVKPVNDPPICQSGELHINRDAPGAVQACADVDGDPLTYAVTALPAHGTLKPESGKLVYQPEHGYVGADSFKFQASDGKASSQVAQISVTVADVNTPPVCLVVNLEARKNQSNWIAPNCSDVNGDPLKISIPQLQSQHGKLSYTGGLLVYTPDQDYTGPDSFTYQVSDGVASTTAEVRVTVSDLNWIFLPVTVR